MHGTPPICFGLMVIRSTHRAYARRPYVIGRKSLGRHESALSEHVSTMYSFPRHGRRREATGELERNGSADGPKAP